MIFEKRLPSDLFIPKSVILHNYYITQHIPVPQPCAYTLPGAVVKEHLLTPVRHKHSTLIICRGARQGCVLAQDFTKVLFVKTVKTVYLYPSRALKKQTALMMTITQDMTTTLYVFVSDYFCLLLNVSKN